METKYIEVIIITHAGGEQTVGIYKFKHEKTAWNAYRRDIEMLPKDTFIQLMTLDNFVRAITRRSYRTMKLGEEKPVLPKIKKKRKTWTAKEAIAAGRLVP